MRLIKVLLAAVVGSILLLTAALLVLMKLIDPNDFKPELEGLAAARGIPLQLQGSIEWQWYPYLGLSLDGVVVGDEPLIKATHLAARVALKPLLQRRLVIRALDVSGVQLNLSRDRTGAGNWQTLGTDQPATAQSANTHDQLPGSVAIDAANTTSPMLIAIDAVSFSDISIVYSDLATGTLLDATELQLTLKHFDMGGRNFQWQSSGRIKLNSQPLVLVTAAGETGFDHLRQQLSIVSLALSLALPDSSGNTIEVEASGQLDLDLGATAVAVDLKAFALNHWLQAFGVDLPAMSAADALSTLALTAQIWADGRGWGLNNLDMLFDKSRISGEVGVSEDDQIVARLGLDRINLDRYLPPATTDTEQAATSEAPVTEPAWDLSPLQSLNGQLNLVVSDLQGYDLQFSNVALDLVADSGVIQLNRFQAGFYEGDLTVKGSLDARTQVARLRAEGRLESVAMKPVLQILADEDQLSGLVSADWTVGAVGDRLSRWQNSLEASAAIDARQITLAGVDVERTACELAALINRKPGPDLPWKGSTTLRDVSAKTSIQGNRLKIAQLQAGVENIGLVAQGELDISSGEFEFPASVAFVGAVDEARKCQVRERWRNRPLPIRCQGDMGALSARTCLPDRKRLDDLLREELKDRAGDKVKETLQEKLGGEGGAAVEELFRGLLRR